MKRNPTGTLWALVTNSGFGKLMELRAEAPGAAEIESRESPSRRLTNRDLKSDASGRNYKGQGPAAHGVQPRSDAHDLAEEQFVAQWVKILDQARAKKRFDQLLLVADPRTLGRLRERMGKALQQHVLADYDQDLTRLGSKALETRLRKLAGWAARG